MEPSNQKLFQTVWQEMVMYKPSLQKVLSSGDDEDENYEQRFIGQMVIKNFPLPIGIELRRLASISLLNTDNQRLEQLYVTLEQELRFIAYILISQLWNEKKLERIVIPESFGKIFRQRIYLRNIENYIGIIQSVTNLFEERAVEFFVPEIREKMNEEFLGKFDFPVPGKYSEGSYIISNNPELIERSCAGVEEKLIQLLKNLSFLANYKLVSVLQIKIVKPKYQQPKYNHVLKLVGKIENLKSFEKTVKRGTFLAYDSLSIIYFRKGDYKATIENAAKAPKYESPFINYDEMLYVRMVLSYIFTNQPEKAAPIYREHKDKPVGQVKFSEYVLSQLKHRPGMTVAEFEKIKERLER
jgi:hypothetical protein